MTKLTSKKWTVEMRFVPLNDLKVEPEYQRLLKGSMVSDIGKNPDESIFGCIHVGERRNGDLFIVDGNHRSQGFKMAGYASVPAIVFPSKGRKHEANVFEKINSSHRKLTGVEIHIAAKCGGNQKSIDLDAAVSRHGFEISVSRSWPSLNCVYALGRIFDWGTLTQTLDVIASFDDQPTEARKEARKGSVLEMVGEFFRLYGHLISDEHVNRLCRLMNKWTKDDFLRHCGSHSNRQMHSVLTLVDSWNRSRLGDKLKIDPLEDAGKK